MSKFLSMLLLLCLGLTTSLSAQQEMQYATSYKSYLAMYKNKQVRMVRSHADFQRYATQHPILKKYFNRESMNQFLKDLIFCENGLVTFKYDVLTQKYPKSEPVIFRELSKAFGWDPGTLGVDYKGYYCAAPDCKKGGDSICIGDNCGSSSSFRTFNTALKIESNY